MAWSHELDRSIHSSNRLLRSRIQKAIHATTWLQQQVITKDANKSYAGLSTFAEE